MERVRKTNEKAGLYLDEGYDYRRYWRGDSGWEILGGGIELHMSTALITRDGLCDQETRKGNCNGQSCNGRLTNCMERQGNQA